MGGSSSQQHTDPVMSSINAFSVEELYMPEFLDSFQENTGYWQEPNPHESPVKQVATLPPKKKKLARARQKRIIQNDDAPRWITWKTEEETMLAGWVAKILKIASMVKRGSKMAFSVRLMVTEMTAQEKEQREAFLEIKRRDVECCELEIAAKEYRQQQKDIRFYLQPYDHLTGDQRMAMNEVMEKIKVKYNLQY
nr:hypothetical protein [Tanacetum cinerariifolium]